MIMKELLNPGKAAKMLGVHASTISRWARQGRLRAIVTPGGHRRILRSEVAALFRTLSPKTEAGR